MVIPMHAGHPLVIHLPLIAFVAAVGFDVLDAWSTRQRFRAAATLLWWAALAGAAAAVGTGLVAYSRVDHSDPAHLAMTLHRNVALGTVVLLLAAALWRWRRPQSRAAALFALGGLAALAWTGDLGAGLVFRHALGVPTARLTEVLEERGGEDHGMSAHDHGAMPPTSPDSMAASSTDTAAARSPMDGRTHTHRDSVPHTD